MAVLLDRNTRLIVQGLTGREGTFHAKAAAAYGTRVVGGVTPGKGGTTHEGWPIFNSVHDAVRETGANATVIFVPGSAFAGSVGPMVSRHFLMASGASRHSSTHGPDDMKSVSSAKKGRALWTA